MPSPQETNDRPSSDTAPACTQKQHLAFYETCNSKVTQTLSRTRTTSIVEENILSVDEADGRNDTDTTRAPLWDHTLSVFRERSTQDELRDDMFVIKHASPIVVDEDKRDDCEEWSKEETWWQQETSNDSFAMMKRLYWTSEEPLQETKIGHDQ